LGIDIWADARVESANIVNRIREELFISCSLREDVGRRNGNAQIKPRAW
jgi:hypothetical protein